MVFQPKINRSAWEQLHGNQKTSAKSIRHYKIIKCDRDNVFFSY